MTIKLKHKEVLKKMVENGGMSREQAMLKTNYSPAYTRSGKIAKTASWEELMDSYLPDEELAKKHRELLNKREVFKIFNHTTGEYEKELANTPDTQAVSKGLDLAYRIKRKFPKEGINIDNAQINIIPIYGGKSKEDV